MSSMTPEVIRFIKEYYPNTNTADMAEELGVTPTQLRTMATQLGVLKAYNTTPEGYTLCSRCKEVKPNHLMSLRNGKPRTLCRACKSEDARRRKADKLMKEKEALSKLTKVQRKRQEELRKEELAKARKGKLYDCRRCKHEFTSEQFTESAKNASRDHLGYFCKECRTQLNREYKQSKQQRKEEQL